MEFLRSTVTGCCRSSGAQMEITNRIQAPCLPGAASRRTGEDRQICTCGSSRNPGFRRSKSSAKANLRDLESLVGLTWKGACRNAHKGLAPFLRLVYPEYTHHRPLFPFRKFCKALQVFEPWLHYTSTALRSASHCGPDCG